eukprot:c30077_g1_i1 orf=71-244(+)
MEPHLWHTWVDLRRSLSGLDTNVHVQHIPTMYGLNIHSLTDAATFVSHVCRFQLQPK